MADPNLEVCPDYALPEFEDARRILTVDGKTEAKAIALLESLWALSHTRNIENWQRQQEADAEAERNRIALAEQEAKQQRALRDEEERKKYKNKFIPIPDRPLPNTPLILLPQHVRTKLRKGDYVPLYFFYQQWYSRSRGRGLRR
ncbi:hypothetical protein EV363DRAFT_844576 [Boletus edulis]|nr:hypothetical protein EV363DRAFT_844576 [Boletus edulis]